MSDESISYANHPMSITELKAEKSGHACDWTVRDCLVELLRDIDSGKFSPTRCVIVWRDDNDELTPRYSVVNTKPFQQEETVGMLMNVINRLLNR